MFPVFFAALFHVHFLPVSIILLLPLSSLWKIIEACFSHFFLFFSCYCTFSVAQHPRTFSLIFFPHSIASNYFCVSFRMIEIREINCIIILLFLSTYPMVDSLFSDQSLQQSLIADAAMSIDHLSYVDGSYSKNTKNRKENFV